MAPVYEWVTANNKCVLSTVLVVVLLQRGMLLLALLRLFCKSLLQYIRLFWHLYHTLALYQQECMYVTAKHDACSVYTDVCVCSVYTHAYMYTYLQETILASQRSFHAYTTEGGTDT